MMKFGKAVRQQAKLRLALTGPSGSGKTYSALLLAAGLGGKIAVIDTERGSASLYADAFSFDTLDLAPPYSPERFREAITEAEREGYDVIIIDSITHEWSGIGGCLEINEGLAASKYRGNTWSAWNETTPRHRAFFDKIMASNCHVIATMRSKTETAQVEDGSRKKVIRLGMKAEQREGSEFEFTVVLDLIHDGHYAVASKDRTGLFAKRDPAPVSAETAKMLASWLISAAPANPHIAPVQAPPRHAVGQSMPSPTNTRIGLDSINARTLADGIAQLDIDEARLLTWTQKKYKVASFADLTHAQCDELIKRLPKFAEIPQKEAPEATDPHLAEYSVEDLLLMASETREAAEHCDDPATRKLDLARARSYEKRAADKQAANAHA